MRIKFSNHITSLDDMKTEFVDMINSLPANFQECTFSGINFYFNLHDKETGEKVEVYNNNGEEITGFTYGRTKKTVKGKKIKQGKSGKVIDFNQNKIAENT